MLTLLLEDGEATGIAAVVGEMLAEVAGDPAMEEVRFLERTQNSWQQPDQD